MASKSRSRNTLLNTVAGIGEKVATIITGFIMRSLFIRLLGMEYVGVSSLFTDILSALSLAELGISSAITYALYKPIATKDNEKVAMLMNFYKRAYQLVAAIIMGVGLLLIPFLGYIVNDVPKEIENQLILIYVLYLINSAVSYLIVYKTSLLTAHQERRYVSVVNIIGTFARVIVEAVILLALKNVLEPTPRFIVYLASGIIMTRLQNYAASKVAEKRYPELKEHKNLKLPKEEQKRIFKDIRALMIYKVCSSLLRSVDSIIISVMFGTVHVGYLGNYTLVTKRVNNVVNQFYNSVSPSIGNMAAESDSEKQYKTFRTLQFMAFWLCCFCSVSFFVLLDPFMHLWLGSRKYMLGPAICAVLTLNFYLSAIVHPVGTFRNANGLFVQGKYRPIVMSLINIGLSVLLAVILGNNGTEPVWGMFGVKLATAIAQIVTLQWFDPYLVYKNVFKKKLSVYLKTAISQLGFTALCCVGVFFIGKLIDGTGMNPYLVFLVKCALCVIIPNLAIIIVYHKKSEFKDFIQILKSLISKKSEKKSEQTA